MKKSVKEFIKNISPFKCIVFIILLLYAISFLAILGWGILTSLKSVEDFTDLRNVLGLPDRTLSAKQMLLYNYEVIISSFGFEIPRHDYISSIFGIIERPKRFVNIYTMLFNTLIFAGVGSFLHSFVSMTMGFLVAKYKYKFSKFLYVLMIVVMALPIVGSQPAEITMMRNLGIYDSYFGMICHKINFTGMYFLVFVAFFEGFSDTYIEAAQIDGASQFYIFLKIVVPLAGKILGTVFIVTFIANWNDYQTPLLYYPSYPVLSYGILRMSIQTIGGISTSQTQGTPQRIAGCMLISLPTMAIFIAFRNVIMGNLSLGGLKE